MQTAPSVDDHALTSDGVSRALRETLDFHAARETFR